MDRTGPVGGLPVGIHGVTGEVQACHLPLLAHPLIQSVLRDFGQGDLHSRPLGFPGGHAKKVQLSLHVLPAAVADGIQELVVDCHQLAAIGTKAVEGPRTDEILHCPLVDVVIIHPLAEVLESGEGSVLLPLPHHVLNKAPANIFDGH